jgi:hypothetical protein
MAMKRQKRSALKSSVKRRTLNQTAAGGRAGIPGTGMPGQEQDPKRRLGNFSGRGEHARIGGRTSGIVGQTSKDFGTDNKRTKSTKPRTKHTKGSR